MKESVFQELAGLSTESRNPDTQNLDTMSTREILEAMNREDRKVPDVLAAAIPQIEQVVERVVQALSKGGRLLYIGAGTSGRLGVLDAAECPPTFGTDPWQVQGFIAGGYDALVRAVEGAEDNPDGVLHDYEMCCINEEDVVVGITASRRTPFVLGGLRHAKAHGCFTALLICNEPPTESMIYEASVDAGLGALAREGGNSVVEKGWVAEETPPNPPVNGGGSEAPLNPPISADVNGGGSEETPPNPPVNGGGSEETPPSPPVNGGGSEETTPNPPVNGGGSEETPPNPPAEARGDQNGRPDVIISLPVGPEVLTGSTRLKAGTATKLALNMISTASWVRMGKCYGNLMVDLRMGSQKLQARARRIMMEVTGCDYEWADELLRTAGGELKTALVMHFRGLTSDHARQVLEECGGKLKEAIADPHP